MEYEFANKKGYRILQRCGKINWIPPAVYSRDKDISSAIYDQFGGCAKFSLSTNGEKERIACSQVLYLLMGETHPSVGVIAAEVIVKKISCYLYFPLGEESLSLAPNCEASFELSSQVFF